MGVLYLPFNINVIKGYAEKLDFDIFLRLGADKYLLFLKKGSYVDKDRLNTYIVKGITCLYIDAQFKESFYKSFKEKAKLEEKDGVQKKIDEIDSEKIKEVEQKTELLTEKCINDLFYGINLNTEHIKDTIKLVKNFMSLMILAPKSISELLNNISEKEYFHYHSVSVSITSIFISKIISPQNDRIQSITGMGGFLHDIGKAGSNEHDLNSVIKPRIVNSDKYLRHPEKGLKLLSTVENVPEEVKIIVYQHHEKPDGTGFPNSLFNVKLYYPSRVVAVANEMSKMVAKHPFGKEMRPKDAITQMLAAKGSFDSKVLQAIAEIYKIR